MEKLRGARPRKTRARKNKKFRFRACHLAASWPHCYWCGKSLRPEDATIEHIVRQADGGSNKPENIAMSCARYNSGRHGGASPCQEPDDRAGFRTAEEWAQSV